MFGYKKKQKKGNKAAATVEREEDNEEYRAYLIDYGLVHQYLKARDVPCELKVRNNIELPSFLKNELDKEESNLVHVANTVHTDTFSNFKGNLMFTSKNGFEVQTLTRRDDLISIIYLLIFLINGKIQKIKENLSF